MSLAVALASCGSAGSRSDAASGDSSQPLDVIGARGPAGAGLWTMAVAVPSKSCVWARVVDVGKQPAMKRVNCNGGSESTLVTYAILPGRSAGVSIALWAHPSALIRMLTCARSRCSVSPGQANSSCSATPSTRSNSPAIGIGNGTAKRSGAGGRGFTPENQTDHIFTFRNGHPGQTMIAAVTAAPLQTDQAAQARKALSEYGC